MDNNRDREPIFIEAWEVFGRENREDRVMEEASEVIQAILKLRRPDVRRSERLQDARLNMLEEVADLTIVLDCLRHIILHGPDAEELKALDSLKWRKFVSQVKAEQKVKA